MLSNVIISCYSVSNSSTNANIVIKALRTIRNSGLNAFPALPRELLLSCYSATYLRGQFKPARARDSDGTHLDQM